MKNRKKHVMDKAHELFIQNGFQSTSIHEILVASGISKGTFYNYFSSKNELLISIFKHIYGNLELERKQLLIGKDKEDVTIFIKQIELLIRTNNKYKVISLFEEILFTNDTELKAYIKKRRIHELNWVYHRLLDIFGPTKQAFLLDCAIMLIGMLHNNIYFHTLAYQDQTNVERIVEYSVNRVINMISGLTETKESLLDPSFLLKWISEDQEVGSCSKMKLQSLVDTLRFTIQADSNALDNQEEVEEMVDFVYSELEANHPRQYIVQSVLYSLKKALHEDKYKNILERIEEKADILFEG
ncbi:TetR/AcrR family transcriptional regulator [Bacillus sp. B1-b2]|uniref:TetR/AcrR family transcriptional regulator n=1 Tax=Bacillus sp. B1-b2 TaxID=2653201 RepID=UPI00126201F5|nr:TetR/AcrR family transcriptional regulator [Bacillus sp. B1-b2]KAB7666273.1 TetR/AcrR family transcriptional regulator [Bacillus sp. B1-b2]